MPMGRVDELAERFVACLGAFHFTMRLVLELRGVTCLDLERDIPDRKSIMASRSFGRPVTALADMREAVAAYTARAAEKLRRQHLTTAHLIVFVE
jgi:DNA polymerase V